MINDAVSRRVMVAVCAQDLECSVETSPQRRIARQPFRQIK